MKNRNNYSGESILAKGHYICNDTWKTGINNNVLVVGPSGSGKTRSYVKPNIMQANTSMIISDCKGNLYRELSPFLKSRGYVIHNIDFTSLESSSGYNPLKYIRYDKKNKKYSEQDILKLCANVVDIEDPRQAFWEQAARMFLAAVIAYVLEAFTPQYHTLTQVENFIGSLRSIKSFGEKIDLFALTRPDSIAVRKYNTLRLMTDAEKMTASIFGIMAEKLNSLTFSEANSLYHNKNQIDFKELGKRKTAVFLTVSDTDRSVDKLANIFWSQAMQELMSSADKDYSDNRLAVPVRMFLDDFASNIYIENFDKITSNIRSREIYVSIIIQSLSQLYALYGEERANTIIGNCDQQLILGIQDMTTAAFFAARANKTTSTMMNMPVDRSYLFIRGKSAEMVEKFDMNSENSDFFTDCLPNAV